MITVLIVEDVTEMAELLKLILERFSDFKAIAAVQNIAAARRSIQKERPKVVLLDEVLPGESALDFLNELSEQGIKSVLMTSLPENSSPVPPLASTRIRKPDWKNSQSIESLRTALLDAVKTAP